MQKHQKGDKKQYVRKAIHSLGLDATFAPASKWIKKKYRVEVSEPTYYAIRKEMQQAAKRGQPGGGAGQPSAAVSEPTPTGAASPQAGTTPRPSARAGKPAAAPRAKARPTGPTAQEGAREDRDGVAAWVLQAKALVAKLGKDEAKKLIDAL
jgi:hypothetical protein